MKLFTSIGVYLLACLMMLQSWMMPLVYLDFKLRQDYIAKVLCINRDQPEMLCNGQCILMQKLKKTQDQEQSSHTSASVKEVLWLPTFTIIETVFGTAVLDERLPDKAMQPLYTFQYFTSVFHPPQL